MKLSRRELGVAAVAAAVAPAGESQTAQPDAGISKVVRDANQRNSEALAKFEIPLATEPAFQFKA